MYTIGALSADRITYVFGCIHRGLYKSFVYVHNWRVLCTQNYVRFWLYYTQRAVQKLCVCTRLARLLYTELRAFLVVFIHRGLCIFLLFFPPSVMAPAHSKLLLDACFRKEEVLLILPILFNILSQIVGMKRRVAVITRTFIWSEEHFRGPVL